MSTHLCQGVPERNTTIVVPGEVGNASYVYSFTMKKDKLSTKGVWNLLKLHCKKFTFQLERGEKTGYEHYQGMVSLKKKLRFKQVAELLLDSHVEQAKNPHALEKYCQKADTRLDGPWNEKSSFIRDRFLEFTPLPWQQEILDIISTEPDDRTIHWYYSPTRGKLGKTLLAKHLCLTRNAVFVSDKGADIKCAISMLPVAPDVCIFYFTKTQEEFMGSCYGAIESIKDGIYFNGKYESGMKLMDCPHVLCLSNFYPRVEALMVDRWHIVNIENLGGGVVGG